MSGSVSNRRIESLNKSEQKRALDRARKVVAEGHHRYCSTNEGGSCDCYFSRGDYLVSRRLVELSEEKPRSTETDEGCDVAPIKDWGT